MTHRIARDPDAFSLAPTGKHTKPVKDAGYLAWLHRLPCIITLSTPVEAAHLSFASPAHGHLGRGKARKASDRWALPLSPHSHREQHNGSERAFWARHGIDPHLACLTLYGLFCEHGYDALEQATMIIKMGIVGRVKT